MNAHVPPTALAGQNAEYVLTSLRCVSQRLKHIDQQVIQIGVALKNGLITPDRAVALCELVAPGCIEPMSETTP
jgi:hypothetical protein